MEVSVCLMVRNEEAQLPLALKSTLGLADEIVLVDTGSTDRTLEMAQEYDPVVIRDGDRRNKGATRNRAAEAAKGDWVVVLDADEQIANPQGLRRHLERTTAQAIYIKLAFMAGTEQVLTYHQMRCWRKGAIHYKYRAHEVPVPVSGDWPPCEYTDFVWEHRPPADRPWKQEHILMLLLMDVEENPSDPRPLYYLGREYTYIGAWTLAAQKLESYLATMPLGDTDGAEAHGLLATCYQKLAQPVRAMSELYAAANLQPQRREWWGLLAEQYLATGQHRLAAGLVRLLMELPRPTTGYVNGWWYGAYPYDLLARCYWELGEYELGLPLARQAVALAPTDVRLATNLRFFEDRLNGSA